jgi:hypothetical protein
MSLQEEQHKRLTTIRALLAKAENEATPPPEAEALSAKAAELMKKHSIDQAMLDAAAAVSKPQVAGRQTVSFAGQDYVAQKQNLLHAIAEHHGCTTVVTGLSGPDPRSFVFGYQSDLALTDMLFTSLLLQAGNALITEDIPWGENARSFTTAWWTAYVSRISTRLYYSRHEAEHAAERSRPGTALVLADREAAVAKALRDEFPETRKTRRGHGGKSQAGRAAGYRAGSQASLGAGPALGGTVAGRAIGSGS